MLHSQTIVHRPRAWLLSYSQTEVALERAGQNKPTKVHADFRSILDWVRTHPQCNGQVIDLGICYGAPFCLNAAAAGSGQQNPPSITQTTLESFGWATHSALPVHLTENLVSCRS